MTKAEDPMAPIKALPPEQRRIVLTTIVRAFAESDRAELEWACGEVLKTQGEQHLPGGDRHQPDGTGFVVDVTIGFVNKTGHQQRRQYTVNTRNLPRPPKGEADIALAAVTRARKAARRGNA